jgi:hypothetical protein
VGGLGAIRPTHELSHSSRGWPLDATTRFMLHGSLPSPCRSRNWAHLGPEVHNEGNFPRIYPAIEVPLINPGACALRRISCFATRFQELSVSLIATAVLTPSGDRIDFRG